MKIYSKGILGVTFLEQALLSIAAFSISIGSTRWLSGEQLTSFFLGWAWMWALVAAAGEGILTPSRVHQVRIVTFGYSELSPFIPKKELEAIGRLSFKIGIGFMLLHFISQAVQGNIIFLIISGIFAFLSFQCLRFSDVDSGHKMKSLRRSFALCFLQIAHITIFPLVLNNLFQNYLLVYIISLLLLSWPRRFILPELSFSEILGILKRGQYFAAGTLVRAILFSSVLISVTGLFMGELAVKRFAVVQTMSSPALFITAALCTGLIPTLSEMIKNGMVFREVAFRIMSIFALVGSLLALVSFLFNDRLSHLLFGAERLSGLGIEIQNLKFAVPFFILAVSIASSIGIIFQLFQMGKAHLFLQLSSGLLAVPSVLFVGDYWIVSIPYLFVVLIFPVFIWKHVR